MNILFLGKKDDYHTEKALEFCQLNADVIECLGDWDDPFPEGAGWWTGDYIVSFLCRWIVPQYLIEKASKDAINFHPGPPEYPGVGCVNFALYDNTPLFGVTAHRLAHPVDSGKIIRVHRFRIFEGDNVETLLERTHDYLLTLFYGLMGDIFSGHPLLHTYQEKWPRKAYTRKQLDDLAEITTGMSDEEIARRYRACSYGEWGLTMRGYKVTK